MATIIKRQPMPYVDEETGVEIRKIPREMIQFVAGITSNPDDIQSFWEELDTLEQRKEDMEARCDMNSEYAELVELIEWLWRISEMLGL